MFIPLAANQPQRIYGFPERAQRGRFIPNYYLFSLSCSLIFGDGGQDRRRLLTSHYRDSRIWPHEEESRAVRKK